MSKQRTEAQIRKIGRRKFLARFGTHLKEARKRTGMSQEGLSMDAGYYRTYVNLVERGRFSPSLYSVWKLAKTLGLSLSDFFKGFK